MLPESSYRPSNLVRLIQVLVTASSLLLVIAGCNQLFREEVVLGLILVGIGLWVLIGGVFLRTSSFQIAFLVFLVLAGSLGVELWMPSPESTSSMNVFLGWSLVLALCILSIGSAYVARCLHNRSEATKV